MKKELIYSLEDDNSISELIKYALEKEGFECVSFQSKNDLLENLKQRLPSLITLDIMLPDGNGIEVLKYIRDTYSSCDIKIIMLTAKADEINIVQGLNYGADDYISKPFSVLEFIARVHANLRKKSVISGDNNEVVFDNLRIVKNKRIVYREGKEIYLTQKEFELLNLLINNLNNVVDRETMLESVWGIDKAIETRTIDMHIKSIREKLSLNKNIITVRGIGYKIVYP